MKKRKLKYKKILDKRVQKKKFLETKKKNILRQRRINKPENKKKKLGIYYLNRKRVALLDNLYLEKSDDKLSLLEIPIDEEFGLEEEDTQEYFLDIAEKLIDFNAKTLILKLDSCKRVWPSGITLMCSLKEWVDFANRNHNKPPLIKSTNCKDSKVNEYLDFSGFHDYVGRPHFSNSSKLKNDQIVRINRETDKSKFYNKEDVILELLHKYSDLSIKEIELFNCIVTTELFLNVTEHGIANNAQGFWLLIQYHHKHRYISFNIADNGVGFRHSLYTGPQKDMIINEIPYESKNDHKYIEIACKENISGAYNASKKSGLLFKNYTRGARRGNGLTRILSICNTLSIPISILSHHGYVFFDQNGNIARSGSRDNRIFGGTLYHLKIKAK